MTSLFSSGGQSIRASAIVLSMDIQGWFPVGLTSLISLLSKGLSGVLLQHHNLKASIFQPSAFFISTSHILHDYWKTIALAIWTFVGNVMSLILNILSTCHSFYSKKQVSFNFMVAVTYSSDFGAEENNLSLFSIVSPSICHEVLGLNAMILIFGMLSFRPAFSLSSFIFIKRLFSSSSLSALRVVSSVYQGYWYFSLQSWFQPVLLQSGIFHDAFCIWIK